MTIIQRYKDPYSILIILGFTLLLLIKAAQVMGSSKEFSLELFFIFLIGGILLSLLYQFFKARLIVKVKKKKMVIKLSTFPFFKIKLYLDQIERIDFLQNAPLLTYTGDLQHFGIRKRVINFGGNKTMAITLRNGDAYYFVSEQIFRERDEILSKLKPQAY